MKKQAGLRVPAAVFSFGVEKQRAKQLDVGDGGRELGVSSNQIVNIIKARSTKANQIAVFQPNRTLSNGTVSSRLVGSALGLMNHVKSAIQPDFLERLEQMQPEDEFMLEQLETDGGNPSVMVRVEQREQYFKRLNQRQQTRPRASLTTLQEQRVYSDDSSVLRLTNVLLNAADPQRKQVYQISRNAVERLEVVQREEEAQREQQQRLLQKQLIQKQKEWEIKLDQRPETQCGIHREKELRFRAFTPPPPPPRKPKRVELLGRRK